MIDTLKHQGLRNLLVKQLSNKGISDAQVLYAIQHIPRHFFINHSFEEKAYQDIAFPIGANQTISRPHTVAFQTELLQMKSGQKILEIGTGSGYQSAILVYLGAKLYTIERQIELFKSTKSFFNKHKTYRPEKMVLGDGYKGLPNEAPFDRILVTAGAAELPQELLLQLAIGGRMVIPIGEKEQIMTLFVRISENEFHKEEFGNFAFVPMLEDVEIAYRK